MSTEIKSVKLLSSGEGKHPPTHLHSSSGDWRAKETLYQQRSLAKWCVCPRLLKACALDLGDPLQHIYNLSMQVGRVPVQCNTSCIVPVPKRLHPKELNDFRPVDLTSYVRKTKERLLLHHLKPQDQHALDPLPVCLPGESHRWYKERTKRGVQKPDWGFCGMVQVNAGKRLITVYPLDRTPPSSFTHWLHISTRLMSSCHVICNTLLHVLLFFNILYSYERNDTAIVRLKERIQPPLGWKEERNWVRK